MDGDYDCNEDEDSSNDDDDDDGGVDDGKKDGQRSIVKMARFRHGSSVT